LILIANGEPLEVLDDEGRVEGLVTLSLIEQLLSGEAGHPAPAPVGSSPSAAVEARPGAAD
jgi:hypothetical protein